MLVLPTRALRLLTLVRLGEPERAEHELAELAEPDRECGEIRIASAGLRLAQQEPGAAVAALRPILDGTSVLNWLPWLVGAYVLEAIAQDTLGDLALADRAIERALDLAEPDGARFFFLIQPAPRLLEGHARRGTAHAALIAEILDVIGGRGRAAQAAAPRIPLEPLSQSEIRVLRYLPTNLSAPEIANELSVSTNTVKTHIHHLYAKLGTHRRAQAVARARDLGLLAPSAGRR
jgi:LuxR family maltose regulon positive regulatory protein